MGAHGVAPTWPAQAGRPQGGAQVILERVGAHRVVPSWFVLRFWSLVPFGVEIERIYLQLGGPTLALIGWAPHGWCLGGSVRLRCLVLRMSGPGLISNQTNKF